MHALGTGTEKMALKRAQAEASDAHQGWWSDGGKAKRDPPPSFLKHREQERMKQKAEVERERPSAALCEREGEGVKRASDFKGDFWSASFAMVAISPAPLPLPPASAPTGRRWCALCFGPRCSAHTGERHRERKSGGKKRLAWLFFGNAFLSLYAL